MLMDHHIYQSGFLCWRCNFQLSPGSCCDPHPLLRSIMLTALEGNGTYLYIAICTNDKWAPKYKEQRTSNVSLLCINIIELYRIASIFKRDVGVQTGGREQMSWGKEGNSKTPYETSTLTTAVFVQELCAHQLHIYQSGFFYWQLTFYLFPRTCC